MELNSSEALKEVACSSNKEIKEILNGEIIYMSPTSPLHNKLVRRISSIIESGLSSSPCELYTENVAISIPDKLKKSQRDYTQPDVFVVCMPEWKGSFCITVPTLIIEVLSTSSKSEIVRDKEIKRDLYQAMGVKEFIIIGQEGTIIILKLEDSGVYSETIYAHRISKGKVFESQYLSNVSIDIDKLYDGLI